MTQRTSLRIWLCLSLAAVAGGSAWTASMLLHAISGFRNAEAGNFFAIGRGVAEANQLSIAALYLALVCAVVAVVGYVRSQNYPSSLLALAASGVALIPMGIVWFSEPVLMNSRNGVIPNDTLIQRFLLFAFGGGIVLAVLFLFALLLRVPPTLAPRRTIAVVSLLLGCLVLAVIGFHLRNAWIDSLYAHL